MRSSKQEYLPTIPFQPCTLSVLRIWEEEVLFTNLQVTRTEPSPQRDQRDSHHPGLFKNVVPLSTTLLLNKNPTVWNVAVRCCSTHSLDFALKKKSSVKLLPKGREKSMLSFKKKLHTKNHLGSYSQLYGSLILISAKKKIFMKEKLTEVAQ